MSQQLDVIPMRQPIVAQDNAVAVVPELLDDVLGMIRRHRVIRKILKHTRNQFSMLARSEEHFTTSAAAAPTNDLAGSRKRWQIVTGEQQRGEKQETMKAEDFAQNAPGELVEIGNGNLAFVPNPLPPTLEYDEELINKLADANLAIGELKGTLQQLANPYLLIRPFQLREAVASSQIEGTQAELQELVLFEAADTKPDSTTELREVSNYVHALTYGIGQPPDREISVSLIREMHQLLMQGVRGGDRSPGQLRSGQVYIAGSQHGIESARFVPPPPESVPMLLNDLQAFLNAPSSMPALVRLAVSHYQFETIHPFNDGNGRVGRLLLPLLLVRWGVMPHPSLYLSDFFNEYRDLYIVRLWQVSASGDWAGWIQFFLDAIRLQAWATAWKSQDLLALRNDYRSVYQTSRSAGGLLRVIDRLFEFPAISIPTVHRELNVSFPTASKWIQTLEEDGVLVERTGLRKNRLYLARGIFDILNAPPFYASGGEAIE